MARWKLVAPHYLRVSGTTWEYKEVDRRTGRPKVARFDVPLLLDPADPSYWTHTEGRDDGYIVVCHEGKGEEKDIAFLGDPTPDMIPLDDEAKAITTALESVWKHPIESLPSSYGEMVLTDLQNQAAKAQAKAQEPQKIEGMDELLTALTAMVKQNQLLIETMKPTRRT